MPSKSSRKSPIEEYQIVVTTKAHSANEAAMIARQALSIYCRDVQAEISITLARSADAKKKRDPHHG